MPPLEVILDVADHATRTAMRSSHRLQGGRWWEEDWEDAHSEAILGILQAARHKTDAGQGYYFRAAINQIYKWMRDVRLKGNDRLVQLDEYANTLITEGRLTEDTTMSRAMIKYLDALPPLLAKHRQRSKKPLQIRRQIEYLWLVLDGYSRDGIALELGVSVGNIDSMRRRLLPRLRAIAENK